MKRRFLMSAICAAAISLWSVAPMNAQVEGENGTVLQFRSRESTATSASAAGIHACCRIGGGRRCRGPQGTAWRRSGGDHRRVPDAGPDGIVVNVVPWDFSNYSASTSLFSPW